jgi:multiple sugar transport system ATP-binding protein
MRIGGVDVTDVPPAERGVAMVFQSYALYPHMTVAENMGFALKIAGRPKREVADAVRRAAASLQLEPLLDRKPRALSGGQRQRVAIGRAIVREPKVFLFDEPLSNLDAALRGQTRVEIAKLHRELGATTIYVTHDQVEAMTLADQVVVLRDGAIEQVGSPLELYDHPANLFVAGFIGSPAMNLIPGTLKRANARLEVELEGGARLPAPRDVAGDDGQRVLFGTRPEHLVLADGGQGLAAQVVVVEPTGADTQVFAKVGATEINAVFRERHTFRAGDPIRLVPDHERTHLFDAASGKSLRP